MLTLLCFQLRKKALLAICSGGVVPPVALLLLGQASPASLWLYLRNGFEISQGFSENMGLEGGPMAALVLGTSLVVGVWILAICLDLSFVVRHPLFFSKSVIAGALVFCGLFVLSLKMSLTRADAVHLQTTPIFLFGCLVAFDPPSFRIGRSLNIAVGVALCGLVAFIHLRQPWVLPSNADLPESYTFSLTSAERKTLETRSFDILGNLQAALPVIPGRYSPRPVFQSYSCYTPALADLNKHHFDHSAPESLFLTRFPIDQRLWTMEDCKMFAEVLASWDPVRQVGPLLWMCPPAELPKKSPPQTSTSHRGEFAKWQRLSPSKDIVFLRFLDLPPSLKIFPLNSGESGYIIACRYSDGTERVFRLPPGIAKTGFVVSPLIQSFRDITIFRQTSSSLAECVAFAVMPLRSETSRGSYDFEVTERKPQRPSDAKNIAFLPIQKFRGNTTPELAWINGVEFLQFAGGSVASLLAEPVFVEALSLVVEFPKGSNASASLCVESFTGNDRILWHSRDSGVANLHNFYLAEGESLILRTEGSGATLVRDARLQLR